MRRSMVGFGVRISSFLLLLPLKLCILIGSGLTISFEKSRLRLGVWISPVWMSSFIGEQFSLSVCTLLGWISAIKDKRPFKHLLSFDVCYSINTYLSKGVRVVFASFSSSSTIFNCRCAESVRLQSLPLILSAIFVRLC